MELGEGYKKYGTEKCPGTKLFTISGHVENPGVYEAPMGTTIGELLNMAGGMKNGAKIKAIQTGGCSGPIVGEDKLSVPMAIEECAANGCSLGTGDLMFVDDSINLVDLCRNIVEFYAGESCGKCIPCRWGLKKLNEMLTDMVAGKLGEDDIDELSSLADHTSRAALCPLGAAGPAPLQSVLKNMKAQFVEDLQRK
jgi:NADH:ubiquinone oxidoreductase subunit F (NADH-binding)